MSSVVNAYVEGDEEHVVLLHRNEDGTLKRHRVLADYAVFFRNDEVPHELLRKWRHDPLCRGYQAQGDWLRTRWRGWNARRMIVHEMNELGIRTYEGDCSPVKRWMADHPKVEIQVPRRCYLDIETDSRVNINEARAGGARILVWVIVDEQGAWDVGVLEEDTDAAEHALIRKLYAALEPFDQICAWGGDDFDFPIIAARTKERRIFNGIPRRWLRMDHLALYKRMNMQVAESGEEKQSFSLNAVLKSQLGMGKEDFDATRTYEAWYASGDELERLISYCHRDADGMRLLEEKVGYIKQHQVVAQICGVFPDSFALLPTAQMDGIVLRIGHERSVHFPTATKDPRVLNKFVEEDPYKGSYNKDPPKRAGILKNVHVVDFSSFYPSVMVSWNMSYETRTPGPPNGPVPQGMARSPKTGVCFRTDVLGLVPQAVEMMLAERKKWSALRASLPPGTPEAHDAERWTNGFKVVPNAFYGAQGNIACRFHDRRVAESITQTCAWLAEKTEWALTDRYPGLEVIYVDTDGLWLVGIDGATATAAVKWLNEELYPKLLLDCGCQKNIVKLAYEKEFERVIFVSAKRYVGRFLHYKGTAAVAGSKPEIKGIAYKRGDATKLTREFQAEIIDLLVGGMKISKTPGPTEDLALYEEAVARWRNRILEQDLDVVDVQTVKGITRTPEQYLSKKSAKTGKDSALPPHVRVALILKNRGQWIGPGSKIAYVVVDAKAKPQGVIPACDYTGECDREHLWDDIVWEPTKQLLWSAFPNHEWKKFDAPSRKVAKDLFDPVVAPKAKPKKARKPELSENLFELRPTAAASSTA